jgi:Flp pilus assembly protein TadD
LRAVSVALLTAAGACAQSAILGVEPTAGPGAATIVVFGTVQWASATDRTALPSDLAIAVDCHHGNLHDGGGVSLAGQFRFTMTPDPAAIQAGNICAVEAKAFGYDSTIARFPIRSTTGMVELGILTIARNASGNAQAQNKERTAMTVSATSLQAPPDAVKLYEQGTRLLREGKFVGAAKDFEGAIKVYASYAESWLNLGRARVNMNAPGPARDAFLRAAQLDPQLAGPSEELGLLAVRQNDVVLAAKYLDESLRLDPVGSFRACYSDAIVNLMLKRDDVAEGAARAALRFGDSGPQARVNYVLGMTLLARSNNVEAKQHLTRYLELVPQAPERDQVLKELNRLEQLSASR